jgi:DNA-binding IclR family transcriptional regulator
MTDDGSGARRLNPVQILAKAGAALDCLASARELTAAQLAAQLGEPRSSVYRLLASLGDVGLVEAGSARGTYRLGLKLFQLGSRVAQRFDERQLALPAMERLHEITEQTVFLCVRRDDQAVCIERLNGMHVQTLELLLGGTLPLHVGAAPQVLLAFETDEFRESYLRRGSFRRFTPKTPVTARKIRLELEEIHRLGYAVSDEDVTLGVAALGAPIFDHTDRIRAALSISGVKPAILGSDKAKLRRLVLESAAEVSRLLGYGLNGNAQGRHPASGHKTSSPSSA